MNPEQFKSEQDLDQKLEQKNQKENILDKAGNSVKKAAILGAVIATGFSADVQAQASTNANEGASSASESNIIHVEKSPVSQEKDVLSQRSMSAFLEQVKKDGIEALSSADAEKYGSLVGEINNYFEKIDLMTTGDVSVEQKQAVGKTLAELHQTLGIVERNLSGVIETMKERKAELAQSQATVVGGAYDLSAADLKEAGQMVMTQKENEIMRAENVSASVSALQDRITAKFHELTGTDLK